MNALHETLPEALPIRAEAELWIAVIAQAINDLVHVEEHVRIAATSWIFGADENFDFRQACEFAGFSTTWVRAKARKFKLSTPIRKATAKQAAKLAAKEG